MAHPRTYAARRAAGLCGDCGKVESVAARCPACVVDLTARRQDPFGEPPATLEHIATKLHLSRERVRQVQEEAIGKLADRMGVSRADVLKGLAILGCAAGEVVDESAATFAKFARLEDGSVH